MVALRRSLRQFLTILDVEQLTTKLLHCIHIVVVVFSGFGENEGFLPAAFNRSNVESLPPSTSVADVAMRCV